MNTVRDLLRDDDPFRHEPHEPVRERVRIRQAITAEVSAASTLPSAAVSIRADLGVTVALIVMGIAGVGAQFWSQTGGTVETAIRFEVRLAEDQPTPGLREARIDGADRVVYLHEATVVTNEDIKQSRVVQGDGSSGFGVAVEFNAAGAQRMRQATAGHVGRPMAILVDGVVVVAPVVRGVIGTSAVIRSKYTRAEAERIVNGIGIP